MRFLPVCVALFFLTCSSVAATGHDSLPVWHDRVIEGWTLHINQRLLDEEAEATAKAVELLRLQLQEIVRVVPAAAVVELRRVPLWFSPPYPGVTPRAEYHPGAGWLRDNGRDPAMVQGVEFTDIRDFERESRRMPNFTLHELAHAYHHRFCPVDLAMRHCRRRMHGPRLGDCMSRWSSDLVTAVRHRCGPMP